MVVTCVNPYTKHLLLIPAVNVLGFILLIKEVIYIQKSLAAGNIFTVFMSMFYLGLTLTMECKICTITWNIDYCYKEILGKIDPLCRHCTGF